MRQAKGSFTCDAELQLRGRGNGLHIRCAEHPSSLRCRLLRCLTACLRARDSWAGSLGVCTGCRRRFRAAQLATSRSAIVQRSAALRLLATAALIVGLRVAVLLGRLWGTAAQQQPRTLAVTAARLSDAQPFELHHRQQAA